MKSIHELNVALGQLCSSTTHEENIDTVSELVAEAAGMGADLVALPEVAGLMNRDGTAARAHIVSPESDPYFAACQQLAKAHSLWIHCGSSPVLAPDGRFLNQTVLVADTGRIVARYSKIHLFDAEIEGRKPIRESSRFAPGEDAVLADTPWGRWGMTICYDLRFPHLFRDYAKADAGIIFVPSAFTVPTGKAHWEVLLRARAIETGCFVVAAAQSGTHSDGRETWGHSLIVDPWGRVLVDLGREAPRLKVETLHLKEIRSARAQIPSLLNERAYKMTRAT